MRREEIIRRFETLNLWRSGGQRAPHKPLLILYAIGRLLRDGTRLIPYAEIEVDLGRLLQQFAPRRSIQGTQFPFWRLQNDEVWEVTHVETIRLTASGDALVSDLRCYKVSGGFTDSIFHKLQSDSRLALQIIQLLLNGHFPPTLHKDILQEAGIESSFHVDTLDLPLRLPTALRRDPNFRLSILKAYEYKCAVCGFDVKLGNTPVALEAAHIKWHQAGGPDETVNGLALCSLHHKLFDRGAFTLSQELEILVSDEAHGFIGLQEWLIKFHGKGINFPQRQSYCPKPNFIGWHIREVFQGGYREL